MGFPFVNISMETGAFLGVLLPNGIVQVLGYGKDKKQAQNHPWGGKGVLNLQKGRR